MTTSLPYPFAFSVPLPRLPFFLEPLRLIPYWYDRICRDVDAWYQRASRPEV